MTNKNKSQQQLSPKYNTKKRLKSIPKGNEIDNTNKDITEIDNLNDSESQLATNISKPNNIPRDICIRSTDLLHLPKSSLIRPQIFKPIVFTPALQEGNFGHLIYVLVPKCNGWSLDGHNMSIIDYGREKTEFVLTLTINRIARSSFKIENPTNDPEIDKLNTEVMNFIQLPPIKKVRMPVDLGINSKYYHSSYICGENEWFWNIEVLCYPPNLFENKQFKNQ